MMKAGRLLMEVVGWIFLCYLVIAVGSLLEVANGENIPYMPFWHGPAKWVIEILK